MREMTKSCNISVRKPEKRDRVSDPGVELFIYICLMTLSIGQPTQCRPRRRRDDSIELYHKEIWCQ
jgi:hypothetical protein